MALFVINQSIVTACIQVIIIQVLSLESAAVLLWYTHLASIHFVLTCKSQTIHALSGPMLHIYLRIKKPAGHAEQCSIICRTR